MNLFIYYRLWDMDMVAPAWHWARWSLPKTCDVRDHSRGRAQC